MTPMTTRSFPCPDCEDGIRWTSRYGGNDPDTYPAGKCETCGGDGLARCSDCSDVARHAWIMTGPGQTTALLCDAHHAEWLAAETEE